MMPTGGGDMMRGAYLVRGVAATMVRASAKEKARGGARTLGGRHPPGGVDSPTGVGGAGRSGIDPGNAARTVGRSDAYRPARGLVDASPRGMSHSIELRAYPRRHWGLMMWLCAASSA